MTCSHATGRVGLVPDSRARGECALHGRAPGLVARGSTPAPPCPALPCNLPSELGFRDNANSRSFFSLPGPWRLSVAQTLLSAL